MSRCYEAQVIDGADFEKVLTRAIFTDEVKAHAWANTRRNDFRRDRLEGGEEDATFINAIRSEVSPLELNPTL